MKEVWKQIFAPIILTLFYPDDSWLNELTDMDHMVDNNTINLAECGADPEVVEDNSVWPLVPVQREDGNIEIPLTTFDTRPTHITNVEELETAYNKQESVAKQHTNTLRKKASTSAAFNIAPKRNTVTTPVLKTTGADRGDGTKALRYEDITELSLKFNEGDLPQEGRVLLLCPKHQADLKNADMKLFKALMVDNKLDGFKVYMFTHTPKYDATTGEKQPYGAATGQESSVAFIGSEVMRSMGDITGGPEERWADYRGWLIGFQMRFIALPFRKFGVGAIYSDKVA